MFCSDDIMLRFYNLCYLFQKNDYSCSLKILEAMKQIIRIKGCFEGIHTAMVYLLHCFRWFPDVEMSIVLYVDDAISTDTLNMSHEPALELSGTDGKHILSWARMNNSPNWWHNNASNSFENSQLVSKVLVCSNHPSFFPCHKRLSDTSEDKFLWQI